MCTAASVVYKAKTVQVKSADDQQLEDTNSVLFCIAHLMSALLYVCPYSSQSPVPKGCYQAQLRQISSATRPDANGNRDNPELPQTSKTNTEQQAGQHDPAHTSPSLPDQSSSKAPSAPPLAWWPPLT